MLETICDGGSAGPVQEVDNSDIQYMCIRMYYNNNIIIIFIHTYVHTFKHPYKCLPIYVRRYVRTYMCSMCIGMLKVCKYIHTFVLRMYVHL